jgi:hypothetical protein
MRKLSSRGALVVSPDFELFWGLRDCVSLEDYRTNLLGVRETVELADGGADALLAWCLPSSPNFSAYLRASFLPLPQRLRPVELHFGVRAFGPNVEAIVANRSRWYISYLDSDTT